MERHILCAMNCFCMWLNLLTSFFLHLLHSINLYRSSLIDFLKSGGSCIYIILLFSFFKVLTQLFFLFLIKRQFCGCLWIDPDGLFRGFLSHTNMYLDSPVFHQFMKFYANCFLLMLLGKDI